MRKLAFQRKYSLLVDSNFPSWHGGSNQLLVRPRLDGRSEWRLLHCQYYEIWLLVPVRGRRESKSLKSLDAR